MNSRLPAGPPSGTDVVDRGVAPDHHHRRRLLAIALLLALAMSIPVLLWWWAARSSAAFADSEVLDSNHLGAATLDLKIGDDTATLRAENMAPGDVVSGQLQLVNAGSLPLRFTMTGSTDGDLLAQWLRFNIWQSDAICRADAPGPLLATDIALTPAPTALVNNIDVSEPGRTQLPVGASTNLCVGAVLLLDAPNTVQGRRTEINLMVNAVHDLEVEQ